MVLHDAIETTPFQNAKPNLDIPYDPQNEAKPLQKLKDTIQNLEVGLIRLGNLINWLSHRTIMKGSYIDSQFAAIPWDKLEDFVQEKQQNLNFPCNFNKRVQRS